MTTKRRLGERLDRLAEQHRRLTPEQRPGVAAVAEGGVHHADRPPGGFEHRAEKDGLMQRRRGLGHAAAFLGGKRNTPSDWTGCGKDERG